MRKIEYTTHPSALKASNVPVIEQDTSQGESQDTSQGESQATHVNKLTPSTSQAATTHRSAQAANTHRSAQAATTHRSAQAATTHRSAQAATTHRSAQAATTHRSALNTYNMRIKKLKFSDLKAKANNAPHFAWLAADRLFSKSDFRGKNCNGRHGKQPLDPVKLRQIKDMVFLMFPDKANHALWKKCKENIDTNVRNVLRKMEIKKVPVTTTQ